MDVKHKKSSDQKKYTRVLKRETWVNHLKKNTTLDIIPQHEREGLQSWIQDTKLTLTELDDIIQFHMSHPWQE
jgi:hypothetical protein